MNALNSENLNESQKKNPPYRSNNFLDKRLQKEIKSVIPKNRQEVLKWYGWGYKDSKFDIKNDIIYFTGKRYQLNGLLLPYFTEWVYQKFGLKIGGQLRLPSLPTTFPEPILNQAFLTELKAINTACDSSISNSSTALEKCNQTNSNNKKRGGGLITFTDNGEERLYRCHGQTLHDIYFLWTNQHKRIPDLVVWPSCHDQVVTLIDLANRHNVVIIPYGGGTSVSGSISCPEHEQRMIVALDTSQMNKMLWLDLENLTVCFEAGIVGQDLEKELRQNRLTVGHEPDSYEFSTLGGWVATRASGMKKNVYGNIEDLVVRVRMATTKGVLERDGSAPRVSCGPDFNHMIMGSEGTLGVVTEVILKVRPLPSCKRYSSFVFPAFESGVRFMREVAKRRCQPASVRLMDNEQFRFGQTLKGPNSWYGDVMDFAKRTYLSQVQRMDLLKICAATLLFEGETSDVDRQELLIYEIAKKYGGLQGGASNGERGYTLTFVIAYIRDFALSHNIVAESFETSVPWDRCALLCRNVKTRVENECTKRDIKYFLISCRVTQAYDSGCCVYFYFAFRYIENDKSNSVMSSKHPVAIYEEIENAARDQILSSGGSLSHHHGVGKIRSRWYPQTVSETGVGLYKAAKQELDPKNIFAAGNLLPTMDNSSPPDIKTKKINNNNCVVPLKSKL